MSYSLRLNPLGLGFKDGYIGRDILEYNRVYLGACYI